MGLSEKKKKLLSEFVNNKCEQCGKELKLEPHRIRRGWEGGKYEHRNIKMVCNACHKLFHSNEFNTNI